MAVPAVEQPGEPRGPRSDPGEPRGPRSDTVETVFTGAFRILIGEGAHALTPQRLHRETGVARTTIYRNWPETADLIADMLTKATGEHDVTPFTGDLDHDLAAAVDSLVFRFNHRPVRPLFGALVEHGRHGAETDIAADYVDGLLAPVRRAIAEAIGRGDLRSGGHDAAPAAEGDAAADRRATETVDRLTLELTGTLLTDHVLLGRTVTDADGAAAIARFLAANDAR